MREKGKKQKDEIIKKMKDVPLDFGNVTFTTTNSGGFTNARVYNKGSDVEWVTGDSAAIFCNSIK